MIALADALHDAARLAQIVRANGLMIVNGVVYAEAGHGITVAIAAHTQVLAELRDKNAIIESQAAEIARLQSLTPAGSESARGSAHLDTDFEGEFGPELLDAGDR